MESRLGKYMVVVVVVFVLAFLIALDWHTVMPMMRSDEYYVDKYGTIHGEPGCRPNSWFKVKHKRIDFIRKDGWVYCDSCLDYADIDKMEALSEINSAKRSRRY